MEKKKTILGLRMATDPRWAKVADKSIEDILSDHAWCEQKAASNAISTIVRFSEFPHLVAELTRIAMEEMAHFKLVSEELAARGLTLKPERKDPYVNDLRAFIKKGGSREDQLADSLLLAAMIEARSCERFRLLSSELSDEGLRSFYRSLMESEAEHYATFIGFARQLAPNLDVDARWSAFLDFESKLMLKYDNGQSVHG